VVEHPVGERDADKHVVTYFAVGIGLVEMESSALTEVKPKHF
jgi:hypothetical protein